MSVALSNSHSNHHGQTHIPLSQLNKPNFTGDSTEQALRGPLLSQKNLFIGLAGILPALTITSILQIVSSEIASQADVTNWQAWDVPGKNKSSSHYMAGSPVDLSNGPLRKSFQLASSYFSLAVCCIAAGLWWYSSKKGPMKVCFGYPVCNVEAFV